MTTCGNADNLKRFGELWNKVLEFADRAIHPAVKSTIGLPVP
jgi:hypothetical protein